ncbi:MAG: MliC family protein [Rhodocyclaceae bacterium]|nr:MliC family protein [Rhodocyclaceae bacterium]
MKQLIATALASLVAAACANTPPNAHEVAFACADGQSLSVRFFPAQEIAVLMRSGEAIELRQQPSGSGFIYSNGPNTIRGKGDELTVEIGRMVPIQCRAKGR